MSSLTYSHVGLEFILPSFLILRRSSLLQRLLAVFRRQVCSTTWVKITRKIKDLRDCWLLSNRSLQACRSCQQRYYSILNRHENLNAVVYISRRQHKVFLSPLTINVRPSVNFIGSTMHQIMDIDAVRRIVWSSVGQEVLPKTSGVYWPYL